MKRFDGQRLPQAGPAGQQRTMGVHYALGIPRGPGREQDQRLVVEGEGADCTTFTSREPSKGDLGPDRQWRVRSIGSGRRTEGLEPSWPGIRPEPWG